MTWQPGRKSGAQLDFERLRVGRARGDLGEAEASGDALPSFLGQVVTVATSLKAGQFCKVVPTTVLGVEQEGGVGVFAASAGASVTSAPVLVYLMGSFVPATGDYLVCRFVDHRWVAETTGGGTSHGSGVLLPSCFCLVPPTLTMTSGDPTCNYGMFQSCTLVYGPPPASMAILGYTASIFTSPELFDDPITGSSFFYYFSCLYNQFFLSRIFPKSPLGDGYRDGILYSWIVGGYGNICRPFQLEYGMAFPGSDATCSVTITGS